MKELERTFGHRYKRLDDENRVIQRQGYKTPAQGRREQSQALPLAA